MSDFKRVQEFNRAAEQPCPDTPTAMTKDEVLFLSKMILDELMEFMITVTPEYKNDITKMVNDAKDLPFRKLEQDELIAEQGDALVDMYYYSLNASAKRGIDLSEIFNEVHEANMAKRDSATGKFIKREDGKIIKPVNWQSPDIVKVIQKLRTNSINSSTGSNNDTN